MYDKDELDRYLLSYNDLIRTNVEDDGTICKYKIDTGTDSYTGYYTKTHHNKNNISPGAVSVLIEEEYCDKLCPYSENCNSGEMDELCLMSNIMRRIKNTY